MSDPTNPAWDHVQDHLAEHEILHYIAARPPVTVYLAPDTAMAILGILDLALRHPELDADSLPVIKAHQLRHVIIEQLSGGQSAARELLEKGAEPEHDNPPETPPSGA